MERIKHIAALFFSLVLMLASVGITLVDTFCECSKQHTKSLFVAEENCAHDEMACDISDYVTCEEIEKSCCQNSDRHSHQEHHHQGHNCDSSDYTTIRLDLDFLKPDKQQEIVVAQLFIQSFFHGIESKNNTEASYLASNSLQSEWVKAPPSLPLTSKNFVVSLQQLKIPHSA